MVNHYEKSPRQWTKKAWIDLRDTPRDRDLGYEGLDLALSRKPENAVILFDPNAPGNQTWLTIEPESAMIDQVATYR